MGTVEGVNDEGREVWLIDDGLASLLRTEPLLRQILLHLHLRRPGLEEGRLVDIPPVCHQRRNDLPLDAWDGLDVGSLGVRPERSDVTCSADQRVQSAWSYWRQAESETAGLTGVPEAVEDLLRDVLRGLFRGLGLPRSLGLPGRVRLGSAPCSRAGWWRLGIGLDLVYDLVLAVRVHCCRLNPSAVGRTRLTRRAGVELDYVLHLAGSSDEVGRSVSDLRLVHQLVLLLVRVCLGRRVVVLGGGSGGRVGCLFMWDHMRSYRVIWGHKSAS